MEAAACACAPGRSLWKLDSTCRWSALMASGSDGLWKSPSLVATSVCARAACLPDFFFFMNLP